MKQLLKIGWMDLLKQMILYTNFNLDLGVDIQLI